MSANTHEFTCTGPVQADIDLGSGQVQVSTSPDLTATVTITAGDGREGSRAAAEQTTVEFDNDRLSIHTPRNSRKLSNFRSHDLCHKLRNSLPQVAARHQSLAFA